MNSSYTSLCLYFTGVENYWAVMTVLKGTEVDYYDIVSRFLEILNAGLKRSVKMSDVVVYNGTSEMQRMEPLDLMQTFTATGSTMDLIVDMAGVEETERMVSKVNSAQLIEIGKQLFDEKRYKAAVGVFHLTGRHGLPYILKALAKAQNWPVIASTASSLIREFQTDAELMEIFAKSFENIGHGNNAALCYRELLRHGESAKTFASLAKMAPEKNKLKFLQQAAMLDDREPEVIIQLAKVAFAERNYVAVLDLLMRDPSVFKYLAQFCQLDCDFSDIVVEFVTSHATAIDTFLQFSDIMYKNGAVYEALGILKHAVDLSKMDFIFVLRYMYYLTEQRLSLRVLELVPGFMRHMCFRTLDKFRMLPCLKRLLRFLFDDDELDEFLNDLKGEVNPRNNMYLDHSPDILVGILMLLLMTFASDGYYEDFTAFDIDFRQYYSTLKMDSITGHVLELYLLYQGAVICARQTRPYSAPILAIGDQMAAAWSGAIVFDEGRYSLWTHPISDLSILKLGMDMSKSGKTVAFWDSIACANRYEGIVLMLGTYDCEFTIPKYVNKLKYNSVERAVIDIVAVYCRIVDQIRKRFPMLPLIVHPAIPRKKFLAPIVHEFNRVLREQMPPHARVLKLYEHYEGILGLYVNEYGVPSYKAYEEFENVFKTEFLAQRHKLVCK